MRRDHRRMETQHTNRDQVSNSLRVRSADFFIMEMPRAVAKTPSQDRNPLRRFLRLSQRDDAFVGNEHMCVAMWELLARC